MNRRARLAGYLLILCALAVLTVAIPNAWATPEQSQSDQMTVPTRTPRPGTPPPSQSTDVPQPTRTPRNTSTVITETPESTFPVITPVTTPVTTPGAPGAAAVLALKMEAAPAAVWPGAPVRYTLTLSNQGTASAQQIVIQDTLPAELLPGEIVPGADARWEGQTLQAQAPILPPGSQLVVGFTARVRPDAHPGGAIVNQANASAGDNTRAAAGTFVTLPPAELPPTGGSSDGIPRTAAWGL